MGRLLAILTIHQFAAYESNGVVKVLPDASARQLPIPVTSEVPANALDDEYVTVMFQAKNMCAGQSVPVLRPLMPQAAHLAAFPQANIPVDIRSRGQCAPHHRDGRTARQGGARRSEMPGVVVISRATCS